MVVYRLNGGLVRDMMRRQNALETWRQEDFPCNYVRYHYPPYRICEKQAYRLCSFKLLIKAPIYFEVVGSCINRKESSLIPTSRMENFDGISTECFSLHQGERQAISKLVSENSLFHFNLLCTLRWPSCRTVVDS